MAIQRDPHQSPGQASSAESTGSPQSSGSAAAGGSGLRSSLRGQTYAAQAAILSPSGGGAPLPGAVQAKMEQAFDADFSTVRVHTASERASSVGAQAYTQGNDVHFAPGQYAPGARAGQELIGHELAHVVQQSKGRVTTQARGGTIVADAGLEREADLAGARAAAGEPVGSLAGAGGAAVDAAGELAVQRRVDTDAGSFNNPTYAPIVQSGTQVGMDVHVTFSPGDTVNATRIGLTQAVRSVDNGQPISVNPSARGRQVSEGDAAGFQIDRGHGNDNPIYGSERSDGGQLSETPMSSAPQGETPSVGYGADDNTTYLLGFRKQQGDGWQTQDAELVDQPKLPGRGANAGQEFETTALALEGAQSGTYYGSVKWGWQTDASGVFRALPFELASASQPTANFTQAAALWNGFSFTPKVDTPDADGNTRTNASTEVTVGGRFVTLGAGTPLHVAPDAGSVGSSILVTLGDTIRIEDGGSWLFCWLPASAITEGRVNADTGTSADGRDITVAQDSRVDVRSESGDRRLVKIVSGVVRATGVMAWAEIIDIRGGETTDLPIPGS